MATVPSDKPLSIKGASGEDRSIAQSVDGNMTGDKSLTTLSNAAGFTLPTSMSDFHGYTGYAYGTGEDMNDSTDADMASMSMPEEWNFDAIGASNLGESDSESITFMDYTPYPIGHENLFDTVADDNNDTPVVTRGFDGDDSWMYIPLGINNLI